MYSNFEKLLRIHNTTPYKVSKATGVAQSSLSDWKRNISVPKIDKLSKIAEYFAVPVDFLLGKQPFTYWADIEKDRGKFLRALDYDPNVLKLIWGIDIADPYKTPKEDFANLLVMAIKSAKLNDKGEWEIQADESYRKKENPATISDDGIGKLDEYEIMLVKLVRNMTPDQKKVYFATLEAVLKSQGLI